MKISNLLATIAVVAGLGAAAQASAATVYMDAKNYTGGAFTQTDAATESANYVAAWTAVSGTSTPGYLNQSFTDWNGNQHNSGIGGANTDLAYHDFVGFVVTAADAGTWTFDLGIDFGYGGTALVDNQMIQTQNKDLWWNGNIDDTTNTLSGTVNLAPGYHVLNVYGFEGCCDGGTLAQFETPTSDGFSTNFGSLAVPEPASWALMLVGVAGMGGVLRSRRKPAMAVA